MGVLKSEQGHQVPRVVQPTHILVWATETTDIAGTVVMTTIMICLMTKNSS